MTQSTLSPADSQSAVVSPTNTLGVETAYHLACIYHLLTDCPDGQTVNELLRLAGQALDLLRRPEAL